MAKKTTEYNPYNLLNILINGKPFTARPIELDGEIHNYNSMTDVHGRLIKPKLIHTTCPDCGSLIQHSINAGDPPFGIFIVNCNICNPEYVNLSPFIDPIQSGNVHLTELSPNIANVTQPIVIEPEPVEQPRVELEHLSIINQILEDKKHKKVKKNKQKLPKTQKHISDGIIDDDLSNLLDNMSTEENLE